MPTLPHHLITNNKCR